MRAELTGHEFDLDALTQLLPSGPVRVTREDGTYALLADEIDNPPTGVAFHEAAARTLARVNGLARVANPGYRPVKLSGVFVDGDRRHAVVWLEPVVVRVQIGAVTVVATNTDGVVQQPPAPVGPVRMAVAAANPVVAEALTIISQPTPLGWVELYKVYEIVCQAVWPTRLDRTALVDPTALKAFTGSANRPDVSGADARHARQPGGRPRQTMTLDEGRRFVSALVQAWIDSLH